MTSQFVLEFAHRPAFGAEDFLVAPSNEAAIALLDRWPDWSASAVLLHGPRGCGKTHLAHVWQARSGALLCPADALIGALLLKLFADRQLTVGEEVIIYLLHHMERSFAAASRMVAALDAAALAAQRRITVPLVRQVLGGQDEES